MQSGMLEETFRRENLPQQQRQAVWVMLACPLALLPFAVDDLNLDLRNFQIWLLVTLRVGLFLASAALARLAYRATKPVCFERYVSVWSLLLMATDLAFVATRPAEYSVHLASHVALVMILYLAVPLPLPRQALFALSWSCGYLIVLERVLHAVPQGSHAAAFTALAIVNVLGFVTSRRHHRGQRLLFASREQMRELQRRTEEESLTDPLTELYNRRGWVRLLASEEGRLTRESGNGAAVFSLDLDELKSTNDRFGHMEGDRLIRRTADCLRRVVRRSDFSARVGGDEFVILVRNTEEEGLETFAHRLDESFTAAGVKASLGYATYGQAGGLRKAWELADAAMYRQKRLGRSYRERTLATAVRVGAAPHPDTRQPAATPWGPSLGPELGVLAETHGGRT